MIALFRLTAFRSSTESENNSSARLDRISYSANWPGQPLPDKSDGTRKTGPLRREENDEEKARRREEDEQEKERSSNASGSQTPAQPPSGSQTDTISLEKTPRLDALARQLAASNWDNPTQNTLYEFTQQATDATPGDERHLRKLAGSLKVARESVHVVPEREALSHLETSLTYLLRVVGSGYYILDESNKRLIEQETTHTGKKEAVERALVEVNQAIDASNGVPPGARREALILVCGAQIELIEQVDRYINGPADTPSKGAT